MKKYDDQFHSENYQIYFKNLGEMKKKRSSLADSLYPQNPISDSTRQSVTTKMQNEMKAVQFLFWSELKMAALVVAIVSKLFFGKLFMKEQTRPKTSSGFLTISFFWKHDAYQKIYKDFDWKTFSFHLEIVQSILDNDLLIRFGIW